VPTAQALHSSDHTDSLSLFFSSKALSTTSSLHHVDTIEPYLFLSPGHDSTTQIFLKDGNKPSGTVSSASSCSNAPPTTMKTDRKVDTVSASIPPAHDSDINHKKRKASRSERRSSTTVTASDPSTHSQDRVTTVAGRKKRASIDEHKKEEERQYTVEVGGNIRKKRVLASPRASSPHRVHPHHLDVEPEKADDKLSRKRNKNGSDFNNTTAAKQNASKSSRGAAEGPIKGRDVDGRVNGDTKPIQATRHSLGPDASTSPASTLTSKGTPSGVIGREPKAHRTGGRSRANPNTTPAQASAIPSPSSSVAATTTSTTSPSTLDHGPQKRVLPSRMLRDKAVGFPVEASLLGMNLFHCSAKRPCETESPIHTYLSTVSL